MSRQIIAASCSFLGCDHAVHSRGLCAGHYKQQNLGKALTPLRHLRPAGTEPAIDFEEVSCPALGSPCHIFRGGKNSHGYGAVSVGKKMKSVHVYVWEKANGPVPDGLMLDHQCRNRPCCNVAHLRVVTARINSLENSESFAAKNAAKTHCPHGHAYQGANLIIETNGRRKCRACKQRRERERYRECG